MVLLIMFNDFRFGLGIGTTQMTYPCLECIFHTKIALLRKHYRMITQLLSFSIRRKHLGHWYVKCVIKHYQQIHVTFFSF